MPEIKSYNIKKKIIYNYKKYICKYIFVIRWKKCKIIEIIIFKKKV